MIGWESRVLFRHYLAEGLSKTAIAERLGISRPGGLRAGSWTGTWKSPVLQAPRTGAAQAGPVPGHHGRDPGRGLRRGLHPAQGVGPCRPAPANVGAGDPVRDGAGPPGPGGLRRYPDALGPPLRPCAGPWLLQGALQAILDPQRHGGPPGWPGGDLGLPGRRPRGDPVRPDALGDHSRRAAQRREAGHQRRVRAVRRPLRVQDPGLQAVSGPDQRQGGAPRSRMCTAASSAAGTSSTTPTWRTSSGAGSRGPPTSGPTAPPVSSPGSASSATSGPCSSRCRPGPTPRLSWPQGPGPRPPTAGSQGARPAGRAATPVALR